MKIVVDIGHPAHVHFFKNFICQMKKRGHHILITASDKDVTFKLLKGYGFDYIGMGSYGASIVKKIVNIPLMDIKMVKSVRNFNPDIFIGIGSIRAAHASKVLKKSCIIFDDTEVSSWEHMLYKTFADVICTPTAFRKNINNKQICYNGYHELAYLHPDYFTPNPSVLHDLGLRSNDRFALVRFVSWRAGHDIGQSGFNIQEKRSLISTLEQYVRVFVSSELPLPKEFMRYKITSSPEKIHSLLHYATLFIGDSQTMTTEAAALATPAIRCNSWVGTNDMGNFIELEKKYGLIYSFSNAESAIQKAINLLKTADVKKEWLEKRDILINDKIDVSQFTIDFVENWHKNHCKSNRKKIKAT